MTADQTRFKKLFRYAELLRGRYLHTLAAYKLFSEFNKLTAPNVVGKRKAESNVKVFNRYKYFILTSKEALRCFSLIELAKFFDEDDRKQTLSIQNIIHYAEKRIESFSKDEFNKYHEDRIILPEIFKNYKTLSQEDLNKIKRRISHNKNRIKYLKNYRDKFLAHDDIKKKEILINKKDVQVLMNIVRNTVDLLYRRLDFASNSYKNYEEEPVQNINRLIENLKEHEIRRISDLEDKLGIKIKKT